MMFPMLKFLIALSTFKPIIFRDQAAHFFAKEKKLQ